MLCLLSSRYQTRNRATPLSFSVVSFIPVFTSGRMDKDEIVSAKNLSKRAGPNTVHTAWLKITNIALGMYFPPITSLKHTLTRSSSKSESPLSSRVSQSWRMMIAPLGGDTSSLRHFTAGGTRHLPPTSACWSWSWTSCSRAVPRCSRCSTRPRKHTLALLCTTF